ncbi:MAG: YfhO family protein [Chloroflexota bacterium]
MTRGHAIFTIQGALRGHLGAMACLWLLAAFFFWPLLTPDTDARLWVQAGDFSKQFYPFHSFAAAELAAGRLPLWNPYMFGGHPFLADPQTATFYPLGLLCAWLWGGDGLSLAELQNRAVLAYPLAATFTYLLGWELTRTRAAALLGAVAFTFSGYLTSYPLQQLPVLETAIWLPLALYLVARAARARAPLPWLLLGALALASATLAGHTQTLLYLAYTVSAYLLYRAWPAAGTPARRLLRWLLGAGWRLALLWGLALGLAGAQLLPTLEFLPLSNRTELPYEQAAIGYVPDSFYSLLLPDFKSEHGPYVGVLGLALAGLGVWRARPWFWLGAAVVGGLLALGGNGPLYPVLHALAPGFALFRDQERAMVVFALALALLAAHGAAWLGEAGAARSGRGTWIGGATALGLACAGVWLRRAGPLDDGAAQAALLGGMLAATAVLLVVRGRGERWPAPAALVVLLLDLWVVGAAFNLSPNQPALSPNAAEGVAMAARDAEARGESLPYRLRVHTDDQDLLPENWGHLLDAEQVNGDSPLLQSRYLDLYLAGDEWRLWQLFNVKYALARGDLGSGLDLVGQAGELRVFHVQWPVARLWATRDVRHAASPAEALRLTLHRDLGPGNTAILEGAPWVTFASPQKPKLEYRVLGREPQRLVAQVRLSDAALLVASEPYYPGWRAFLDGQETPLLRSNYYLRAVNVPAGEHLLELRYQPESLARGLGLSLGAAGIWLLGFLLWLWRRKGMA